MYHIYRTQYQKLSESMTANNNITDGMSERHSSK
jgi:hypothetical protein